MIWGLKGQLFVLHVLGMNSDHKWGTKLQLEKGPVKIHDNEWMKNH